MFPVNRKLRLLRNLHEEFVNDSRRSGYANLPQLWERRFGFTGPFVGEVLFGLGEQRLESEVHMKLDCFWMETRNVSGHEGFLWKVTTI